MVNASDVRLERLSYSIAAVLFENGHVRNRFVLNLSQSAITKDYIAANQRNGEGYIVYMVVHHPDAKNANNEALHAGISDGDGESHGHQYDENGADVRRNQSVASEHVVFEVLESTNVRVGETQYVGLIDRFKFSRVVVFPEACLIVPCDKIVRIFGSATYSTRPWFWQSRYHNPILPSIILSSSRVPVISKKKDYLEAESRGGGGEVS